MDALYRHRILILDFGSQYSQLIARRVRECGVYCELLSWRSHRRLLQGPKPMGIILSGGPETATLSDTPAIPSIVWELGVPILGICYGMQAMARQFQADVKVSSISEFGYARATLINPSPLFEAIEASGVQQFDVWASHGDQVTQLPPSFELLASTEDCPIAAMQHRERQLYGLQFHPEVTHTDYGTQILDSFVSKVCGCEKLWIAGNITADTVARLKRQVGTDKVVLGFSGGIDSAVTALLLQQAIGEQLHCIFVDNGLLRKDEPQRVMETFPKKYGLNLIQVDAGDRFFKALKGVTDPEQKRKVVGNTFIEVFEQEASRIAGVKWLAQGTIYPDVIESATSSDARVIKSHHNVGGLPETMQLRLIEPLRDLFKDEVRALGIELGLTQNLVYRHPFPGPGLSVRILGEVKPEYAQCLREVDALFIQALQEAGLYREVSQAFAVFLPVKSVGVVGDARRYEYVVALRAVQTVDFMTAKWAQLPYELLEQVSNRIINSLPQVSRVTYDISSKPPATIEWE